MKYSEQSRETACINISYRFENDYEREHVISICAGKQVSIMKIWSNTLIEDTQQRSIHKKRSVM